MMSIQVEYCDYKISVMQHTGESFFCITSPPAEKKLPAFCVVCWDWDYIFC